MDNLFSCKNLEISRKAEVNLFCIANNVRIDYIYLVKLYCNTLQITYTQLYIFFLVKIVWIQIKILLIMLVAILVNNENFSLQLLKNTSQFMVCNALIWTLYHTNMDYTNMYCNNWLISNFCQFWWIFPVEFGCQNLVFFISATIPVFCVTGIKLLKSHCYTSLNMSIFSCRYYI